MAGSPRKRARKEAIASGRFTPGDSTRRAAPAREPTDEQARAILESLERGDSLESAAAYAGVLRHWLRVWMTEGKRALEAGEDSPLAAFAGDIEIARERGLGQHLSAIADAGRSKHLTETTYDADGVATKTLVKPDRGDWRARAWLLERLDKRFVVKVQIEIEREMSAVLDVLERELDKPTYDRVLAVIASIAKGADA